jgi:hypothetical protein
MVKNYMPLELQNQSGGWELRNSFYKGAILKKDISIIKSIMKIRYSYLRVF